MSEREGVKIKLISPMEYPKEYLDWLSKRLELGLDGMVTVHTMTLEEARAIWPSTVEDYEKSAAEEKFIKGKDLR